MKLPRIEYFYLFMLYHDKKYGYVTSQKQIRIMNFMQIYK